MTYAKTRFLERKNKPLSEADFSPAFEIKALGETGEIEGYAATYGNVDQGNDVIEKGAFSAELKAWSQGAPMPKMLWQHDPQNVIGVWNSYKEDDTGLYLKGRIITELEDGKRAHILLKNKAIDGLSIGYKVRNKRYGEKGVRHLLDLKLVETSIVTFPMNELALVRGVKNLQTIRDVEHILRDAGVPNALAKLIALKGFDAAMEGTQRDADLEADEGLLALQQELNKLKETIRG